MPETEDNLPEPSPSGDVASRRFGRRRVKGRHIAVFAVGSVAAIIAVLWIQRIAISDSLIRQELEDRGIAASYQIEAIGLRTQRLTNLVVGDPKRPDLTAKTMELTLDWGWTGPIIRELRADRVRLRGKFQQGAISFGDLDKFSDPKSTEPFAIPDINLRLTDAQLSMATPWGAIGIGAVGSGNLRSSFNSKIAIVAPRLADAGCIAEDGNLRGDLRIRNAEPQFIGPVNVGVINCASQQAQVRSLAGNVDVKIAEDMARWSGHADFRTAALGFGANRAQRLTLSTEFTGGKRTTYVTMKGGLTDVSAPQGRIKDVGIRLQGDVGAGKHMFDGNVIFAGAEAGKALTSKVDFDGKSLAGTPLGPLAEKAARGLTLAMQQMSGTGRVAISGDQGGQKFALHNFKLQSASGAEISSANDSEISAETSADGLRWRASGAWMLDGGGLPTADLALRWRSGGDVVGRVEMEPYSAGTASLALAPFEITGGAQQGLRFKTALNLSGPLADGRVDQAIIPLQGRVSVAGVGAGAVALDGGCHVISARSLLVSGYQLNQPRLDVCSAAGADLLRFGPDGLRGEIVVPKLALEGQSGDSALAVQAGQSRYDLARGTWAVNDALVRLTQKSAAPPQGSADDDAAYVPTQFFASSITGRTTKEGLDGDLKGAQARIAAVPLNMSEIDGAWRWRGDGLALVGQLLLTDAQVDARFKPMVAQGAELRFADGKITALAGLRERETGRKVVEADIVHRFGTNGGGEAKLLVKELRFDPSFQPAQISRLALGVVAEVDAVIVGDGFIRWNDAGVTSGGTFATVDANLAAAFGPVVGLTGTMVFDDLLDLHTRPGQVLTIKEVNPGIPVYDGRLEYALIGNNQVRIESGLWPLAGGELRLHPTTLDFATDETRHLAFEMVGIDAAHFLQRFGFENLNVTGIFDGSLPVEFGGLGGRVVDGRIDSRSGGGSIQYVGELTNRNLGAMANFAFGALRSLTYDDLSIVLNGALDGEMVTDIRFGGVGQGEGATQNFLTRQIARIPMIFNVKVSAPFRSLFTTVKGLYDPTVQIEEKLPELYRQQQELEARQKAQSDVVQPLASEPVR